MARDDGWLDIEFVTQQLYAAPCRHGVIGAQHDCREHCADVRVRQDCADAVGAKESVAEFQHDDIRLFLRQTRQQRARQLPAVLLRRRDDAEIREDHRVGCAGVLHRKHVASQRDAGRLARRNVHAEVPQAADDGTRGRCLA